jgi:hypothetical protein
MQLVSPSPSSDRYEQTIRNTDTGEEHRWFMTLCEDYTNAVAAPAEAGNLAAEVGALANDIYWR